MAPGPLRGRSPAPPHQELMATTKQRRRRRSTRPPDARPDATTVSTILRYRYSLDGRATINVTPIARFSRTRRPTLYQHTGGSGMEVEAAVAEKLAAPPQEPCASDKGWQKEAVEPREAETAALQGEVRRHAALPRRAALARACAEGGRLGMGPRMPGSGAGLGLCGLPAARAQACCAWLATSDHVYRACFADSNRQWRPRHRD